MMWQQKHKNGIQIVGKIDRSYDGPHNWKKKKFKGYLKCLLYELDFSLSHFYEILSLDDASSESSVQAASKMMKKANQYIYLIFKIH